MALVTSSTYAAFFSTDGRRRAPRSVDPQNLPPPVIRSDEKLDMDKMIKKLRARWPHQCNGIFAKSSQDHQQWHLHWYFDEYDFYVHGGKFLYDLLSKMQQQNELSVLDFVGNWSKANEHMWSSIVFDQMTVQTAFNDPDRSRLGEEFLAICLRHIKSKYYGALAQYNEKMMRGYQEYAAQMNAGPFWIVNNGLASTTNMRAGPIDHFGLPSEHLQTHHMRAQGMSVVPGLAHAPQLGTNDGFNYESAMAKPFLPNHQIMERHQNDRARETSRDDRKPTRGRGGKHHNTSRKQSFSSVSDFPTSTKDMQKGKSRGNSFTRPVSNEYRQVNGGGRSRENSFLRSEEGGGASEMPPNALTISENFVGHDIDYLTSVYLGTFPRGAIAMGDLYSALNEILDVEWVGYSVGLERDEYPGSHSRDPIYPIFAGLKSTDAVRHLIAISPIRCFNVTLTVRTPSRLWRSGREGHDYEIPVQYLPKHVFPDHSNKHMGSGRAGEWHAPSLKPDHKISYSPQDARSTLHEVLDGGTVPPDRVDEGAQVSKVPVHGPGGHSEAKSASHSPPKKSNRRSSKMESIVEEKTTSANNHEVMKTSQTVAGARPEYDHVLHSNATADRIDPITSKEIIKPKSDDSSHEELGRHANSKYVAKKEHEQSHAGAKKAQKSEAPSKMHDMIGKDKKQVKVPRIDNDSHVKKRNSSDPSAQTKVTTVDATNMTASTSTSQGTFDNISNLNHIDTKSDHVVNAPMVVNQGGAPLHSLPADNILGLNLGTTNLPDLNIESVISTSQSRESGPTPTADPILASSPPSGMAQTTATLASVVLTETPSSVVLLPKIPLSTSAMLTTGLHEETTQETTKSEAGAVAMLSNQDHGDEPASSTSSFLAPASTIERPKSSQGQHELASWTKDFDKTLKAARKLPIEKQGDLIMKAEAIRSELLLIEQKYGDAMEKTLSSKKTVRKTHMKKVKQLQEGHNDKILELFALHGDCQRENARFDGTVEDKHKDKKKTVVPAVVRETRSYPQHHPDAAVFNTRHRNAQGPQQWLVIILLALADSETITTLSEMQADESASRPAVTTSYQSNPALVVHDLSSLSQRPFVSQIHSIDDLDSFDSMMRKHPRTGLALEGRDDNTLEDHDDAALEDNDHIALDDHDNAALEGSDDTSTPETSADEADIKAPDPKTTSTGGSQQKVSYASVAKRQAPQIVPALPKVSAYTKPKVSKRNEKSAQSASDWQVNEDWSRTGGYQKKV